MDLHKLGGEFSVCRLPSAQALSGVDITLPGTFLAVTRGEVSLVCAAGREPEGATVEPGWSAFRVAGTLDFGLVGILAGISAALAGGGVSLFAVSTFDTDYFFVKTRQYPMAEALLKAQGYRFVDKG